MEASMLVLRDLGPRRKRNRSTKSCLPCQDNVPVQRPVPYNSTLGLSPTADLKDSPRNTVATPEYLGQSARSPTVFESYEPLQQPGTLSQGAVVQLLDHIALHLTASCELDPITKQTTYVGKAACLNFFRALSKTTRQSLVPPGTSLESAFALDNRSPVHPFGSLWMTVDVKLTNVLQAWDNSQVCMRYYRSYQQAVHPFYPYLHDPAGFERRFLDVLPHIGQTTMDPAFEEHLQQSTFDDAAWYGLLFAVLALGCQHGESDPKERVLRTRVLVVCAFECLRLANFYVQPSLAVIQCELMLETALVNDCNPGVAQSLLGLTAQQAQALGLHLKQDANFSSNGVHPLWQAIIMLDSTVSTAFDRRPVSFLPQGCSLIRNTNTAPGCEFRDTMQALHTLVLDCQNTNSKDRQSNMASDLLHAALNNIDQAAQQSFGLAHGIQGRLNHLVYTIHASTFRAQLIRYTAISKGPSDERKVVHLANVQAESRKVVDAFVTLKQLSPMALISWDILHNAMSSALLLAGLSKVLGGDHNDNRATLERMIRALPSYDDKTTNEAEELVIAPFHHGLQVLKYLVQ